MSTAFAWLPPDLAFTPEHLAANRAGQLHPDQRSRLESIVATQLDSARLTGRIAGALALLFFGGPVLFAAAVGLAGNLHRDQVVPFAVVVSLAAFAVALVPGGVFLLARWTRKHLEAGLGPVEIVKIVGPIQKREFYVKGRRIREIIVDTFKLAVSDEAWENAPEGAMLCIYAFAPKSGLTHSGFLSGEPHSPGGE